MNTDKDSYLFTTPDKRYSWTIPSNWEQYDDGEADTYAFFNSDTWRGNLRITPIVMKAGAAKFIEEEIEQNSGAVNVRVGEYDCAYYQSETIQDDIESIIYYWTAGANNTVFICSLTIEAEEYPDEHETELEAIRDMISSIRIN